MERGKWATKAEEEGIGLKLMEAEEAPTAHMSPNKVKQMVEMLKKILIVEALKLRAEAAEHSPYQTPTASQQALVAELPKSPNDYSSNASDKSE
ncbi:hypothetical protein ABVT39_001363 [Epinephelus coioides]